MFTRIRWRIVVFVVVTSCGAGMLVGCDRQDSAPTAAPPSACPRKGEPKAVVKPAGDRFVLYDNTHFRQAVIAENASAPGSLVKSNVISQNPPVFTGPDVDTKLPKKSAFQELVRRNSKEAGPIVLDLESFYLRGPRAYRHFELLVTMARWTREAAPGHLVGFYGVLNTIGPNERWLAKKLSAHEDAFFPSLYTFGDDRSVWRCALLRAADTAAQLDPSKPVLPYLMPFYHEQATTGADDYLPSDFWAYQLASVRKYADGAVAWSGQGHPENTDQAWVTATHDFLRTLKPR